MICGFTEGVSVDVLYFKINDFFEVNLPYGQSRWHDVKHKLTADSLA